MKARIEALGAVSLAALLFSMDPAPVQGQPGAGYALSFNGTND